MSDGEGICPSQLSEMSIGLLISKTEKCMAVLE